MPPSSMGRRVTYPNLQSLPVFQVLPGMTPHMLLSIPSRSCIVSWRYMNPPHSAMQGMPDPIFERMSSSMDLLDSSSSPWSSG